MSFVLQRVNLSFNAKNVPAKSVIYKNAREIFNEKIGHDHLLHIS
jgi:hypothetical protein